MVMSDCNVEMDKYVTTQQLSVGQTFSVPDSPYSIKIDSMVCSSLDPYARLNVYKDGNLIGTKDYHPFSCDPASCPTLFDSDNICVAQSWMDCVNNKSDFRIFYNEPELVQTHGIDLYIQKYSWISVNDSIQWLLSNMATIDGKLINYFTGLTGWEYLGSDVLSDPDSSDKVILRIKLADLGTPAIPFLLVIKIIVLLTLLTLGVIVAYKFYTTDISGIIEDLLKNKKFDEKDVANTIYGGEVDGEDVTGIVPQQLDLCDTNCGTDAACLANCYKSVVCGAANGTNDVLKLGIDCTTQEIDQKIDACYAAYQSDNDWNKYKSCLGKTAEDSGKEIKEKAEDSGGIDITLIALIAAAVIILILVLVLSIRR